MACAGGEGDEGAGEGEVEAGEVEGGGEVFGDEADAEGGHCWKLVCRREGGGGMGGEDGEVVGLR